MEQIVGYADFWVVIIGTGLICGLMLWIVFAPAPYLEHSVKYQNDVNDFAYARELIREDLERVENTAFIVTCAGLDICWGGEIAQKIEALAGQNIQFTFIVTESYFLDPQQENGALKNLVGKENIEFRGLKKRPPVDLRLIDYRDSYISHHGVECDPKIKRKFIRTWGGQFIEEIEETTRFIAKLLRQSRPIGVPLEVNA